VVDGVNPLSEREVAFGPIVPTEVKLTPSVELSISKPDSLVLLTVQLRVTAVALTPEATRLEGVVGIPRDPASMFEALRPCSGGG